MNKVFLIGNLGKDPEFRAFENGGRVAKFTLATNESFINKSGEKVVQTEWHDIEVWEKQAEIADKYLKKGSKVMIEGKIRTDSWQDKTTHEPRQKKVIRCTHFEILSEVKDQQAQPSHDQSSTNDQIHSTVPGDDGLPF